MNEYAESAYLPHNPQFASTWQPYLLCALGHRAAHRPVVESSHQSGGNDAQDAQEITLGAQNVVASALAIMRYRAGLAPSSDGRSPDVSLWPCQRGALPGHRNLRCCYRARPRRALKGTPRQGQAVFSGQFANVFLAHLSVWMT